ncbi:alpha-N-arabinofuranosidase [Tessaracoccus sp. MC1627]|uniref:alpha-N-arabinofuranosidase n=1 Tax=Tessaracoccus sp. MC1627 TaxID=2760312 RepID=UPI0016024417|nr:alpha-L-arabinofuranosidase C-terminal domain-containing protein [Tessaracoccus sp. MC1627]MBB1511108.1 alpha-N-arabinofuranosidase [Tessaracoccus sp. MC1627]
MPTAHAAARVVINADHPEATISRHLYGHFAEHLGRCIYGGFYVGEDSPIPNVRGIRSDVVAALKAISIPNLRWPGGCFADEYHWRDGIGPRDQRPTMINTNWGDIEENNHFGTHEFFDLCEMLGADAYVAGNVGSGTVQEMSDWVEYISRSGNAPLARLRRQNGREEPWKVPFWGIGNEPWGCGGGMDPKHYAAEARRYATFCRDHSGNTLYRIAAGASDDDVAWTRELMEAISCFGCHKEPMGIYQGISFHYYTASGLTTGDRGSATHFSLAQYYSTISKAQDVDRVIQTHKTVMDAYDPNRRLGLILDEWGTWWDVEPGTHPGFLFQQNALRDALVAAIHFDAFHVHADRLVMANIAQTLNVLQAMILTDSDSGDLVLTPTYHIFEMNKAHQDATALHTRILDGPPPLNVDGRQLNLLSTSASTKNGRILISLSNLDAETPIDVTLDIRGAGIHHATARLLSAPSPSAHNTIDQPHTVSPTPHCLLDDGLTKKVTLPPHSFATVTVHTTP